MELRKRKVQEGAGTETHGEELKVKAREEASLFIITLPIL